MLDLKNVGAEFGFEIVLHQRVDLLNFKKGVLFKHPESLLLVKQFRSNKPSKKRNGSITAGGDPAIRILVKRIQY